MGYCPKDDPSGQLKTALQKSPLLKYFGKPGQPGANPLVRDFDVLDDATRYFGCWCNVTTFACTAEDAFIEEYAARVVIQKSFTGGKSNADMDVLQEHGDETSEGRLIIGFCCMTILSDIFERMRKTTFVNGDDGTECLEPLIKEMTFDEVKNYLLPICLTSDGRGNRRWLEVTEKQHMIAQRMGFPDLYRAVPEWGPK